MNFYYDWKPNYCTFYLKFALINILILVYLRDSQVRSRHFEECEVTYEDKTFIGKILFSGIYQIGYIFSVLKEFNCNPLIICTELSYFVVGLGCPKTVLKFLALCWKSYRNFHIIYQGCGSGSFLCGSGSTNFQIAIQDIIRTYIFLISYPTVTWFFFRFRLENNVDFTHL